MSVYKYIDLARRILSLRILNSLDLFFPTLLHYSVVSLRLRELFFELFVRRYTPSHEKFCGSSSHFHETRPHSVSK